MKLRSWGLAFFASLLVISGFLNAWAKDKDKQSQSSFSNSAIVLRQPAKSKAEKANSAVPAVKVIPTAAASQHSAQHQTNSAHATKKSNPWKPSHQQLVRQYGKNLNAKPSNPVKHFRNYRSSIRSAKAINSVIQNGGFEENPGTLTSWTVNDQAGGIGSWFVQTGTGSPINNFPVEAPPEGIQAAMTDTNGPGSHLLYQDFLVPSSATLSFDLYAQNLSAGWSVPIPETLDYNVAPNQHIRVDIMDPAAPVDDVTAGVLENVFLTDPSDPMTFGYINVTTDLSAYAGQTIRLRFAEVDNQGVLFMGVDNVTVSGGSSSAGPIGLVADYNTNSVVAFNPVTDAVLGTIAIPAPCGAGVATVGDIAITPDGTQAFVTNFCNEIYVIDLTVTPPVLATGTNPIGTSQSGEDLSVTADGKYLLVSNPTISVIDIASRTEIGGNGTTAQSVDVCSDNSIVTSDFGGANVHRFTIDSAGAISDTGESLGLGNPVNAACVPGSATGLASDFGQTVSYGIPGLALADQEPSNITQTTITNRAGNKVYVRNTTCGSTTVDYLNYDFATGALTSTGISITTAPTNDCWFAIDQLAVYGNKLFVSEAGAVNVYNASTGASIGSITDAAISNPTGIAIWIPPANGVGLIADNSTNSAIVFDPGTDTVTGVVSIPANGGVIGDTAISKDGTLGFVTNFGTQVYVIDLSATPPVLAAGTNPISVSNDAEDLSITPDGNFLVVTGGSGATAISVVDIAARTEIGTFPSPANGVDVCNDNSVLIVSDGNGVRRLTVDGAGNLSDTGESLASGTNNVSCVAGALTGVTGDYFAAVNSFAIPGLSPLDNDVVSSAAQAFALNKDGDRLFVFDCGGNQISAFDYDPATGALSSDFSIPGPSQGCWYGIDTLAVHPDGSKLYVSSTSGAVDIYDTNNGAPINSITDSAIVNPTGVSVHVETGNGSPLASDDNYSTPKGVQLNIGAPGVLSNDTDPDADPLIAVLDAGPSNGLVTLNPDGSFTYTPDAGFAGADSFTYHANDGTENSNVATVNIDVLNASPVAVDDNYSTAKNVQLDILAPGVLGNDSDPDGDPLIAIPNTDPSNGTLTLNADGSFTYTPNNGFQGTDSFTYVAYDGFAPSNLATVNIDVINTAPVAGDDSYVTDKNVQLVVTAPGVLGNDSDADGDALFAILVTNPTNGTLSFNDDGSFTYTPNTDYVGPDSFTYFAKDGLDSSNTATVNLTVNQTCLYCDDFNDGTVDPNWTYVKPLWTESNGSLSGTPTGRKAVAVATPVFAGCQTCSMEASMQSAGGAFNKVWMLGWYVDKKNTMELLMKEENERWVLKQRFNGSVVAKGKGIKTIDPNTAYAVRIVFNGTVFQVFVDDFVTPLFTLNPAATVPVGTVGFQVKNTTAMFDYVTVN
jgi:hypothetical protein